MSQLDSANLPSDQLDPMTEDVGAGFGPATPAGPAAPTPTQKQGLNVYTMMLVISFIAICIACTMMYMELQRFGSYPYWNINEAQPQTSHAIELAPNAASIDWSRHAA